MRCIFIHAIEFEYQSLKKSKIGRKKSKIEDEGSIEDCIVVKCSVSPDDTQLEASKVISSLLNHAENIGVNSIVLFPYAHLFEDLSEPEKALNLLDFLYDRILEEFQDAIRVPFGWYKEYTLHSHGHPLSAAAREF